MPTEKPYAPFAPFRGQPSSFLHTDRLGSTLALGCHKQTNGCADRTVYRYYRYSAYGQMKAYDSGGTLLPSTQAPTVDRLYTGQVWDTRAQMYYYNARFYEPKMARFMSMDPVREQHNPYAYVAWNPLAYVDPTGMVLGASGIAAALNTVLAPNVLQAGWVALLNYRSPGQGGFNGPNGSGPGGGAGQSDLFGTGPALANALALLATQTVAQAAQPAPAPSPTAGTPSPTEIGGPTATPGTLPQPSTPTPGSEPPASPSATPAQATLALPNSPTPSPPFSAATPAISTPFDYSAAADVGIRAAAAIGAAEAFETSSVMLSAGVAMLAVPDPTFATKAAAGVALTGSLVSLSAAVTLTGIAIYGPDVFTGP